MRRMSERELAVKVRPATTNDEPAIVLKIGTTRYVCTIEEAIQLATDIADTATQLNQKQDTTDHDQRPA